MNAKHTPGPWIADGYNVRVRNGRYIAYTGPSHTPPSEYPKQCAEEDKANARLIAAAPELLEALENLMETCEYGDHNADEYNAAVAAIAKAKGES
jgi:hypothetical protein